MNKVIVHKARTNILPVNLGYDISADTFSSQIRSQPDHESTLIATWNVAFLTDGTDGKLVLTLYDEVTEDIEVNSGYMDLKRLSGGERIAVFEKPLEVEFRGVTTP